MFNNISWQGYWIFLALTTASYYLFVYLLYYRNDFGISWNRTRDNGSFKTEPSLQRAANESKQPTIFGGLGQLETPGIQNEENIVHVCMDELTSFFEEAKRIKTIKGEMIYSLHRILKKYPTIKDSEYKESVNNVIVVQCENICSVHLSAEDMVQVWFG
jgi:hypothetical protein